MTARIDYARLNGATVNDPRIADMVIESAARIVGEENVVTDARTLAGEDMSVYLERVPGCFFFVGVEPPGRGLPALPAMVQMPSSVPFSMTL